MKVSKGKILNGFSGLGGNRKYWSGNIEVTAIETNEKVIEVYKKHFTNDTIINTCAYNYIYNNHDKYNFVWASPPCQSHSRLALTQKKVVQPDTRLWELIAFLEECHRKNPDFHFVVENVKPYYSPPIPPTTAIGRHFFWSSFFFPAPLFPTRTNIWNRNNSKEAELLKEEYGIQFEGNIYLNSHNPSTVLRNCVPPSIGKYIFDYYTSLITV